MKSNLILGIGATLLSGGLANRQVPFFFNSKTLMTGLDKAVDFLDQAFHIKLKKLAFDWEGRILAHPLFPKQAIRIKEPKLCDNVQQYSGYLDTASDKHFFFWFFESRNNPSRDPLVLWLSGGPGCSSLTGLLTELGPCKAQENKKNVTFNKYGWNQNANVIFLDQPLNTGYSYGSSVNSTVAASDDVYAFLQLFFKEFPKYRELDFHIFGESYGGHYVPEFAKHIYESNKVTQEEDGIRLKSIGVGNGLTNPIVQYKYYPDMACDNSYGAVLTKAQCKRMKNNYPKCRKMIKQCYKDSSSCTAASLYCDRYTLSPYMATGKNPYDVRKDCGNNDLCYNVIGDMEKYLNQKYVRKELGARNVRFEACNEGVNRAFYQNGDMMKPFEQDVAILLDGGIRVLIYAGDADFICNWMGNKAWTMKLPWKGHDQFVKALDHPWVNSETGEKAGELRSYKNFAFLRLFNAGHLVPYDQPENALDMVTRWIYGDRM